MVSISLWTIVGVAQAVIVVIGGLGFFALRFRSQRKRLLDEIQRLEEELSRTPDKVSLDAEPDAADRIVTGSLQIVLLSQEDVDSATRPQRGEPTTPDELCQQLLRQNQELSNSLNQMLEQSAELGMKLGSIRSVDSLDEAVKTEIQEAIDQLRTSDERLVEAADAGIAFEETIRHLQDVTGAVEGPLDHVGLNEILMARADGQSEEELAQLREEVRQRLLGTSEQSAPGEVDIRVTQLSDELCSMKVELDEVKAERKVVEDHLAELTEEYQRLFEHFQPA